MTSVDGQSELDTVTMRLPALGLEIKTWDRYSIREDYLTPAAAFDFTFSTNDPTTYNAVLVDGAQIEIAVNDRIQLTGTIEKVRRQSNRDGGLRYQLSGRDFYGPVVSGSANPKIKITSGQTVADFLSAILAPYGITTVYVGDEENFSVVTGFARGKGKAQTKTYQAKVAKSRAATADGKSAAVVYETKTITEVVSRDRPDLKTLPLDQRQVKVGDGAHQTIEKILSRIGLHVRASADGSGVIVDSPRFGGEPTHRVFHRLDGESNVLDGSIQIDGESQPACVVMFGATGGADIAKTRLKVCAVNELVAVKPSGALSRGVRDILAQYPGITVLPLRSQLVPTEERLISRRVPVPMFMKDDESKSIAQLTAFARRTLSAKQRDYLKASYVVRGHTVDGAPWAINSIVDVDDDYRGFHGRLWCAGRTFTKSREEGTRTSLDLILPYTLELGS